MPQVNEDAVPGQLGQYYMLFAEKADYAGQYDSGGIPLLDYHGTVGLQYNPIAIAQYGLANFNQYRRMGERHRFEIFQRVADWLVANLERNRSGFAVWNHHFDWDYRSPLKAPWYSALSQGQGVSVLIRAHAETGNNEYLDAAHGAFETLSKSTHEGGVSYVDSEGYTWLEESIVEPPTHILNGFIWASWGVYDYYLHTGSPEARDLFDKCVRTLRANLHRFDAGFWSLYEQSGTMMKMMASPFYHALHITQLQVMHKITGEEMFAEYALRWSGYSQKRLNRATAIVYKAAFKLLHY